MIFDYPPRPPIDDSRGFIVIPDLHGRLQDLELVLAEYPDRNYILLGDLVDRGPTTRGVINRVRELVEAGRARLCMGNHEWMMIGALVEMMEGENGNSHQRESLWLMNGGAAVMNEYGSDIAALLADAQWISEHAEQWIVAAGGLFAHAHRLPAGIVEDYEAAGPRVLQANAEHMSVLVNEMPHLWNRPGEDPLPLLPENVDYSVHGHTPQQSGAPLVIRDTQDKPAYFIDMGAVFGLRRFSIFDTAIRQIRTFDVTP